MRSLIWLSAALPLIAALASCLDFDQFVALPPAPVCPTQIPTEVCVAPSTDFTEAVADLPFQANPLNLSVCGDDQCLSIDALPNERNEATSKATGGLGDACVAAVTLVDPTTKAWSFLALVSGSHRVEVATRPGKVRLTAGSKSVTDDISSDSTVDTLRIHHTGSAFALEALAGGESVACFTIDSTDLASGDYQVRIGVDARSDADVGDESTEFDAYGSAAE